MEMVVVAVVVVVLGVLVDHAAGARRRRMPVPAPGGDGRRVAEAPFGEFDNAVDQGAAAAVNTQGAPVEPPGALRGRPPRRRAGGRHRPGSAAPHDVVHQAEGAAAGSMRAQGAEHPPSAGLHLLLSAGPCLLRRGGRLGGRGRCRCRRNDRWTARMCGLLGGAEPIECNARRSSGPCRERHAVAKLLDQGHHFALLRAHRGPLLLARGCGRRGRSRWRRWRAGGYTHRDARR